MTCRIVLSFPDQPRQPAAPGVAHGEPKHPPAGASLALIAAALAFVTQFVSISAKPPGFQLARRAQSVPIPRRTSAFALAALGPRRLTRSFSDRQRRVDDCAFRLTASPVHVTQFAQDAVPQGRQRIWDSRP